MTDIDLRATAVNLAIAYYDRLAKTSLAIPKRDDCDLAIEVEPALPELLATAAAFADYLATGRLPEPRPMAEHTSRWDRDYLANTITVTCATPGCGWSTTVPSSEEAADAWGDHQYELGLAAGRASVTLDDVMADAAPEIEPEFEEETDG